MDKSGDNGKKPTIIFQAELVTLESGKKDIKFTCNTKHIPTLDTIFNELNYYIIMMRDQAKAKQAKDNAPIIHGPASQSIIDKLRGR